MDFKTGFNTMLKDRGFNHQDFADKLGCTKAAVDMALYRNSPDYTKLIEWSRALGYSIVAVPDGANIPDSWIVFDKIDEGRPAGKGGRRNKRDGNDG